MDNDQRKFWLNKKRKERRSPFHPVVTAFVKPKIEFIKKNINLESKATLLDVGCGNGYFTLHFAKHYDVTGLDYSEVMLNMNPYKKLVLGNAYKLPFSNDTFDIVFCSNLLHHLSSPWQAIEEMKRVSKRYIIISEPNRNNPLMFLFGLFNKEEWGSLKSSQNYFKQNFFKLNLVTKNLLISGMTFPNKTPASLLPILKFFDFNFFMGGYITIIAEKCEE